MKKVLLSLFAVTLVIELATIKLRVPQAMTVSPHIGYLKTVDVTKCPGSILAEILMADLSTLSTVDFHVAIFG